MNFKEAILNRISNSKPGTVFIAMDFFDIADYETVRKTLNRLTNEGKIQRILKGIYYNPVFSNLIGEYEAPSAHQVALAIARKYNWTITPSGNTALNLLGLSTQVSAKWTYVSDGRYVKFTFENTTIEFKHSSNALISKMSPKTAMIIHAIKAIGKDNIRDTHIEKIGKQLSSELKENLLLEARATPRWIHDAIKRISNVEV